ncbi:ArsR/SmtB family transcription factor [Halorussus halophilus]|uniref:ArsR/SmtB family transcription factor n=1 Tax=Halorussus halophilus TaxID=2650975 RepID=UPI001300FBCF|nr:metalloregulator ArsR/SmtB family transcription factor [Halorussus halophilus]
MADVFQLLADPTRRRLVELTASEERSVGELVEATELSQPAVSKQLRQLREGGLVSVRKSGRKRFYQAETEELQVMVDWLLEYGPRWSDRLDALEDHLDEM